MLLQCVLAILLFSSCNGQQVVSCSVPTVCTRDDGSTFTTWRPMEQPTTSPPTQPPAPLTTRSTTSSPSGQFGSETVLSAPGWYYGGNDYQYWVSNPGVAVPRSNAESICNQMYSQIATVGIRTNASRVFIIENILKRCADVHGWWIGLTDVGTEGLFVWDDGLVLQNETDWYRNQPDNSNNADCTTIARYFSYKWDDVPCESANNGVLCERYIGPL